MAESEEPGAQEEPPIVSDQGASDAGYAPTGASAVYILETLANKQRKWRKYAGPGLLVLGGIIIAVPNEGDETTSYVAGGMTVGAGLYSLIFPWPAEKALEDMRLIQDLQEREQMAYQWLEKSARRSRIGRYTASAVAVGFAVYDGTQENYVGVGAFSGLALYVLLAKSKQEKVFEELKEGKQAAWLPEVIADIGPKRASIKLNCRF